ncbi:MAG: hypothetical protein J0J15_04595 [Mesorhizobium sp.]|nr:hypothetical protein [Mesorhizobium sp.]
MSAWPTEWARAHARSPCFEGEIGLVASFGGVDAWVEVEFVQDVLSQCAVIHDFHLVLPADTIPALCLIIF